MRMNTKLTIATAAAVASAAAFAGMVSAGGEPQSSNRQEETTVTSMPAAGTWTGDEARVAKLDGRLHTAGLDEDQTNRLLSAADGSCVSDDAVSKALSGERAADSGVDLLESAIASFGCEVSTFDLSVSDTGLTGSVATTDQGTVDSLQSMLGKGVTVELDYVGVSEGPGA